MKKSEKGKITEKFLLKKLRIKKSELKITSWVKSNNASRIYEEIKTRVGNSFHSRGYSISL